MCSKHKTSDAFPQKLSPFVNTFQAVDDVFSYAPRVQRWLLTHDGYVAVEPLVVVLVHRDAVQHHLETPHRIIACIQPTRKTKKVVQQQYDIDSAMDGEKKRDTKVSSSEHEAKTKKICNTTMGYPNGARLYVCLRK